MACGGALLINSFTFIRYRIDHGLLLVIFTVLLPSQSYITDTTLLMAPVSEVLEWLLADV